MSEAKIMEVRLHGRGGQGVVLAATLAAEVAFDQGYFPQAFPFFGAERRGAPVKAFLRISNNMLMPRSRIYHPCCTVAFDEELPPEEVAEGLLEEGVVLINSTGELKPSWLEHAAKGTIYTVHASGIAADLGLISSGLPLVSCIMVGALFGVLKLVDLEGLEKGLKGRIPRNEEQNIEGAKRGFLEVEEVQKRALQ